ncbi:MAE_28990/MAE_18760 family HEPN-like nuclease [Deinococcus arenicola]|uniref:HEPN domain-containing protein n=1 Tax=Deinococcus arenicola TaxID=2994950 RepID=A0ABU4DS62_9DEIO|nr:HEPN domain-containing protein [Deinococcus sp. ZS9-10]MDV6374524.1 HEPN domain-containing protein [Deinococcus sp. ZS9-10]
MPSLISLDEGISFVDALISLESAYIDPPAPSDNDKVIALRGASLVLMVATFEDFLKQRMKEAIKYIDSYTSDHRYYEFDNLPDRLIINHFYLTVQYASTGSGYDGKKKAERIKDIKSAAIDIAANRLDAEAFAVTRGNPNPETLKELLKNIGISEVFDTLAPIYEIISNSKIAQTFIHDKLESLIKLRNKVAHTGKTTGIARKDVNDFRDFIYFLSLAIDEVLKNHCESVVLACKKL